MEILTYIILYYTLSTICYIFGNNQDYKKHSLLEWFVALTFSPFLLLSTICSNNFKKIQKQHRFDARWKGFFQVKNFLRPCFFDGNPKIVLANKYCILELRNDNYFYLFNKSSSRCCRFSLRYQNLIEKIIENFSFETTEEDVVNIINDINKFESKECQIIIRPFIGSERKYFYVSVNDMSVAELMQLPGVNLGKANKIFKYIQRRNINTIEQFLELAELSEENKNKVSEIFKDKYNKFIISTKKLLEIKE